MYNDLACLDQYLGETWIKGVRDKWKSWFNKNNSTTTSTTTTTFPTTTTIETTTNSPAEIITTPPTLLDANIPNKTTEVISDLSIQDARDGLEFFKIYNDFMLAKLASRLSQNAHERRMLSSADNPDQNISSELVQGAAQTPVVPDFSKISEDDIKVLKKLDSCLKNNKNLSNLNGNVPIIKSDDIEGTDVTYDRRGTYENIFL